MRLEVYNWGRQTYSEALLRQSEWNSRRRLALCYFEPEAVYTCGLRSKPAPPVLQKIPVLRLNRGGQMTYHGPGQLVIFPAVHLPSAGLSVKSWVHLLLNSTKLTLETWGIESEVDLQRPGVFTERGKIVSIGLKISQGWNRHGISLNVAGDLSPFRAIEPCGLKNVAIDQMSSWRSTIRLSEVALDWCQHFEKLFA